jgi:hypothetical protein
MDVCIMQLLPFFTVPQAHERFHPGPRLSSNFKFFKIIVSDESFSMHVLLHLNLRLHRRVFGDCSRSFGTPSSFSYVLLF